MIDYSNIRISTFFITCETFLGPSKVIFVRNLAFQVSEDELKDIFEGCKACRIPPNEYGQSKG